MLQIWFWPRGKAPAGTTGGSRRDLDPSKWGTPAAFFPATGCDMKSHFSNRESLSLSPQYWLRADASSHLTSQSTNSSYVTTPALFALGPTNAPPSQMNIDLCGPYVEAYWQKDGCGLPNTCMPFSATTPSAFKYAYFDINSFGFWKKV